MANPVLNNALFVDNAAIYTKNYISEKTRKALLVYARTLELAAIGGTNYTASNTTALLSVVMAQVGLLEPDQLAAAEVHLAFINAAAAGATVPGASLGGQNGINAKIVNISHLEQADDRRLDQANLWLLAQLGFHKSRPQ